jgi:hypothetical protein
MSSSDDLNQRERVRSQFGLPPRSETPPAPAVPTTPRFALTTPAVDGCMWLRRDVTGPRGTYLDEYQIGDDAEARVGVWISEAESHTAAVERLLDVLMMTMAPSLPTGAERGVDVGEIAFAGVGEVPTTVMFVRGPVFVRVVSQGRTPVSIADLARAIDGQLQDHLAER